MKIQVTAYETTYTIETPNDDQDITDMLEMFERMLLVMGYVFKGTLDLTYEENEEIINKIDAVISKKYSKQLNTTELANNIYEALEGT